MHIPLILDVRRHYDALRRGARPQFEPAREFRDYIAWLAGRDSDAAESFWRRYLEGFENPTPVAKAKPKPVNSSGAVDDVISIVSNEVYDQLKKIARDEKLTLNTLVQGALALTLGHFAGVDDVVFGVTVAGRPLDLPGAESTLGSS